MQEKNQPLTPDQVEFACEMVAKWMRVCDENNCNHSAVDVDHSALLRRLLSGKKLHKNPPPTRMSYPAWEMVEEDEICVYEIYDSKSYLNTVMVDQSPEYEWEIPWKILKHKRLGIRWEYSERETKAITISKDPKDHTYIGKYLRRIKDGNDGGTEG